MSNANDNIAGTAAGETINTGNGNDTVLGAAGNDVINGGNGNDTLSGDAGNDKVSGGNGNDVLAGGDGNDILDGGNGDDALDAGAGNDSLSGGNGDDTLDGGAGSDDLSGGNGKDILIYNASENVGAVDIYDGGNGTDTLRLVVSQSMADSAVFQNDIAQLQELISHHSNSTYSFQSFDLTVSSIEDVQIVVDTSGQTIIGDDNPNTLIGTDGDDTIFGLGDKDVLQGRGGNDHLDGGDDIDLARYDDATGGITVDLTAGTVSGAGVGNDTLTSIERIRGSDFADTYNATGFAGGSPPPGIGVVFNEFEGGGGDDTITGNGFTRVSYLHAAAGVTVAFTAPGTGTGHSTVGDDAGVGVDSFTGVNKLRGSDYDDVLLGSANPDNLFENFEGRGGNDLINGGDGIDRALYQNDPLTTSGITVDLANGIVTGDASVGTDTLRSIESVRGTQFADHFDATGFNGSSLNAGSKDDFNEFEGQGGDDTIVGNGNTRISYLQATAGVTVDLAAGVADGDASVGHDILSGVAQVRGSTFDDMLQGSDNPSGTSETFEGLSGDDTIDGRDGFDIARYDNNVEGTSFDALGITVDMAAGTVDGLDATAIALVGHDTLRSIEGIRGTDAADSYDATGFSASSTNSGSNGTLNQFEGFGGDDIVTGNGNTRISYQNALAGITVEFTSAGSGTAHGTDPGDLAGIGTDTFTGVSRVRGSQFNDVIHGTPGDNVFEGLGGDDQLGGGGGNDTLNGGDGFDIALFGLNGSSVTVDLRGTSVNPGGPFADSISSGHDTLISIEGAIGSEYNDLLIGNNGANMLNGNGGNDVLRGNGDNDTLIGSAGIDRAVFAGSQSDYTFGPGTVSGPDGSDTTTGIELLQFDDSFKLGFAGTPIDLRDYALPNGNPIFGRAVDDTLIVDTNANGRHIDLGDGNDTLTLGAVGTPTLNLDLTNVETVNSIGGTETINLQNVANGLTIDLGTGFDTLNLAEGDNILTAVNAETLVAAGSGNDTVTFIADDSVNQTIDLGFGTNVLNLAGPNNSLNLSISGGPDLTVNGQTDGGDENITVLNQQAGTTFNLGAGNSDVLTLTDPSFGLNEVTVEGVEQVFGGGSTHDTIHIVGTSGTTEVTGGFGSDTISASNSTDVFRFTSLQDSYFDPGTRDVIVGFNADQDVFKFDGMAPAFKSAIDFIGTDGFHGDGFHSEAHLVDNGPGDMVLEIDADADGDIGANDMTIELQNFTGTFDNSDFHLLP